MIHLMKSNAPITNTTHISIRGARQHNLKNISLDIPKRSLTVIAGLSGSGKSSLAFDTIYAEGQRRYVESLSAYARQFLDMASKPDVDSIDGLSPAIAIDQKTTSKNPRSTVGTITEIYDYLRLLFSQCGTPHCPTHDIPIAGQTVSQMVDTLLEWPEGTRLHIFAPVVRGRKGEYKKDILGWQKTGYTRIRINGELHDMDDTPELDKNKKHTLEVLVDRMVAKEDNKTRLADSIETSLKLTGGTVLVEPACKTEEEQKKLPDPVQFSEKHACNICGHTMADIEPRMFSFNSPYGACNSCDGLGEVVHFSPELVVHDGSKSIREGAIHPWKDGWGVAYYGEALAKHFGFSLDTAFDKLPEDIREMLLYGSEDDTIQFTFNASKGNFQTRKTFEGVIPNIERRWRESQGRNRDLLDQYRTTSPCPSCNGQRLSTDALAVKIAGKNISDTTCMSIVDTSAWFESLADKLSGNKLTIAAPILREITARLGFLVHVGLGYLTLNRKSGSLSGGESQRIRLASQVGSGLTGVLYVLDEPSIGLHQRDNEKLLTTLKALRDMDNTIIVVEHDEDAMNEADHVIDIGPGAGRNGGQVIAEGTAEELKNDENSITGAYLSGKRQIRIPTERRKGNGKVLSVKNASGNNLKNVDAHFPLGMMTCVTGVSGSGKSTLVMDTLHSALSRDINRAKAIPAPHDKIHGIKFIDKIVNIDQSPIGRTPRSNPATYTGIMTPIRDWYAGLPEAQSRGYTSGRFSFNVKGGRCSSCEGDGMIKVEMHFLADVYVPCEVCNAQRYNRETLEIKYKDKSIADVLNMTVEEALELFEAVPSIRTKLQTLMDVGLSYIQLGQSATTLSGGEAQRIKLSKELSKRSTGQTLYILDEPTTGLHFADIELLLKVLHRLVDEGNSMVIIEHNLDVVKTADHVIEVGPEGGDAGGQILIEGTPEEVAKHKTSHTARFLAPMLKPKKPAKKGKKSTAA
jgi:excinuclease ABC subunit A